MTEIILFLGKQFMHTCLNFSSENFNFKETTYYVSFLSQTTFISESFTEKKSVCYKSGITQHNNYECMA